MEGRITRKKLAAWLKERTGHDFDRGGIRTNRLTTQQAETGAYKLYCRAETGSGIPFEVHCSYSLSELGEYIRSGMTPYLGRDTWNQIEIEVKK